MKDLTKCTPSNNFFFKLTPSNHNRIHMMTFFESPIKTGDTFSLYDFYLKYVEMRNNKVRHKWINK